MTPRRLDPPTVQRRLHEMRLLLGDLVELGEVDRQRLLRERSVRHVVERVLSQLVDLANGINTHVSVSELNRAPDSFRHSFREAAVAGIIDHDLAAHLEPSAGMRNALVHDYLDVDPARVADAVPLALEHYGEYIRQVARWLRERVD